MKTKHETLVFLPFFISISEIVSIHIHIQYTYIMYNISVCVCYSLIYNTAIYNIFTPFSFMPHIQESFPIKTYIEVIPHTYKVLTENSMHWNTKFAYILKQRNSKRTIRLRETVKKHKELGSQNPKKYLYS